MVPFGGANSQDFWAINYFFPVSKWLARGPNMIQDPRFIIVRLDECGKVGGMEMGEA
jgi:hypothetical protein